MKHLSIVLGLMLMASPVFAHSPLESTLPAKGASLSTAPANLALTFKKPVRITKVTLSHSLDDTKQSDNLTIPTKKFVKHIVLEPKFQGPGNYKVEWRALGQDGHALKGAYSFTIAQN